jgi:beta-1,4-N-acetylglucosaminyltransferase
VVQSNGLRVEWFRFAPSLAKYFSEAELVISHAGSGSTFESLRAGRKLVAVPNPVLMDNHQQELAEELAKQKYCICSSTTDLLRTLKDMNLETLVPFQPGDPEAISAAVDTFMRRPQKSA